MKPDDRHRLSSSDLLLALAWLTLTTMVVAAAIQGAARPPLPIPVAFWIIEAMIIGVCVAMSDVFWIVRQLMQLSLGTDTTPFPVRASARTRTVAGTFILLTTMAAQFVALWLLIDGTGGVASPFNLWLIGPVAYGLLVARTMAGMAQLIVGSIATLWLVDTRSVSYRAQIYPNWAYVASAGALLSGLGLLGVVRRSRTAAVSTSVPLQDNVDTGSLQRIVQEELDRSRSFQAQITDQLDALLSTLRATTTVQMQPTARPAKREPRLDLMPRPRRPNVSIRLWHWLRARDLATPDVVREILQDELSSVRDQEGAILAELANLLANTSRPLARDSSSGVAQQQTVRELSHSLGTPLARIRGEAGVLLRSLAAAGDDVTTEAAPRLERIAFAADLCQAFLISFRRLGSYGQRSLVFGAASLADATRQAVYLMRQDDPSKRPKVRINLPDQITGYANSLIIAMLTPLLENAVEASPGHAAIEITGTSEHTKVILRITNDVEEPRSADEILQGRSTKPGHEGLGLSAARHLIQSVKGELLCDADDRTVSLIVEIPKRGRE